MHATGGVQEVSSTRKQLRRVCRPFRTSGARVSWSAACTRVRAVDTEVEGVLRLELDTLEAQKTLRFEAVRDGRGQAVVVSELASECEAWRCGVRPGQRVLAISDPVRVDEMWEMGNLSSARYVRDALKLRSSSFVRMHLDKTFSDGAVAASSTDDVSYMSLTSAKKAQSGAPPGPPAPVKTADRADNVRVDSGDKADDAAPATMSFLDAVTSSSELDEGTSDDDSGQLTVAQRLEDRYRRVKANAKRKTPLQERKEKREEYLSQVSERNDAPFFALVALAVFAVPVGILCWAFFSGYLDQLARGWRP